VSANFGWVFSDGVSGDPVIAGDGNIYDRVDPKDSGAWGLSAGFLYSPNMEVGFLFNQQLTNLVVGGTNEFEAGDMTVNSYHGYWGYNFGEAEATVRPYALIGLGATSFGSVEFTRLDGSAAETRGETQFSTTWSAGVKIYPSPNVGIRVGANWTPVYIKTDTEGYWCDPYWGCYLVGDAQYSNQLQLLGGVTFRF
jgi:opacity protein-like surface antigen